MTHLWPTEDRIEKAVQTRASTKPDSRFEKYQTRPQAYAKDILGVTLTPDQDGMLQSVADNRYTLVKASHAVGKTFTAAVAESWWFDCWSQHIGYITAPTWDQSFGLTFKQLKSLRRATQGSYLMPYLYITIFICDAVYSVLVYRRGFREAKEKLQQNIKIK